MEENAKPSRVREMFGSIAGRYDFLNHFLSANIDRHWRDVCVGEVRRRLRVSVPQILDIGCGTADLSLCFSHIGPVVGCDFCQPMLKIGAQKVVRIAHCHSILLLGADALELPFADASFDVVVSAFVLRNLADMDRGFREMLRVLRPGGVMGVLEFGMPRLPVLRTLYRWYFLHVLPRLGRLISGVDGPYGYLPNSVQAFPPAHELKRQAEQAGFVDVTAKLLTGGIAILLTGSAVGDQRTPATDGEESRSGLQSRAFL
jgi:demethylmenaquinone methyltransferase/2-methoxy-6-polyprenyl-1,4-benzoquinol methylase